jgi:transcriptional regulator with XRE-family HTH domain
VRDYEATDRARTQRFAELLRRYRRARELTQAELAERAGISERSLSNYERGEGRPYSSTLERLIEVLDLDENQASELRGLVHRLKTPSDPPDDVYQDSFAGLTDGLAGLPGPMRAFKDFIQVVLEQLDEELLESRRSELDRLDEWLGDPDSACALLVAETRRGTSALLIHWAMQLARRSETAVAFVPISKRFNTAIKRTAFALLGARLRYLRKSGDLPPDTVSDSLAEWSQEIAHAFGQAWTADRPLVIVLDGMDEADGWTCGQRGDLQLPSDPGQWIKVLVSTRSAGSLDATGWRRVDQLQPTQPADPKASAVLVGELNAESSRVVIIGGDASGTIFMGDTLHPDKGA